jgi:hypothetical protein
MTPTSAVIDAVPAQNWDQPATGRAATCSRLLTNPGALLPTGVPLTRRKIKDRLPELPARTDAQLCEHLPEVPLDSAGAKEESRADLWV